MKTKKIKKPEKLAYYVPLPIKKKIPKQKKQKKTNKSLETNVDPNYFFAIL